MKILSALILLAFTFPLSAQSQKKSLSIEDFDQWKSLRSVELSANGKFLNYFISPQVGDKRLVYHNIEALSTDTLERVKNKEKAFRLPYLVISVGNSYDSTRQLKLAKTKKDDFPKDSLFVKNLESGEYKFLDKVESWKMAKKNGEWLLYTPIVEAVKDSSIEDSTIEEKEDIQRAAAKSKEKAADKDEKGKTLVIYHLPSGDSSHLQKIDDFGISRNGDYAYFTVVKDSANAASIKVIELRSKNIAQVTEMDEMFRAAFDTSAQFFACTYALNKTEDEKAKKKDKENALVIYDLKKMVVEQEINLAKTPDSMEISQHAALTFSGNGERLFFGLEAPKKEWPEDSTILPDEKPKLDVWSHQDKRIQPQQLKELKKDEKASFQSLLDIKKGTVRLLENDSLEGLKMAKGYNERWAVMRNTKPYEKSYSWEYPWPKDIYLFDLKKNKKQKLLEKFSGGVSFSSTGRYLLWYAPAQRDWFIHDLRKEETRNITANLPDTFYRHDDDHPMLKFSYGSGGWLQDDEALFINSEYAVWQVDPSGKIAPKKIIDLEDQGIRVRLQRRFSELNYHPKDEDILLSYFSEKDKSTRLGWWRRTAYSGPEFSKFSTEDVPFPSQSFTTQSLDGSRLITRFGSSTQYPELYCQIKGDWKQLSNTNPQQKQYKWYETELVSYINAQGKKLNGILYKPENIDPNKKYPMVVYFYEKLSRTLHSYQRPRPSYSTISKPLYTSNDYFVFVPDIEYQVGQPGKSAYDCIVPGVLKVLYDHPEIDKRKMALSGQSWGGYQTAHLVTMTNMFACGMAGAPVSNMTSAYGGIRWGSGLNRAFQYEHSQSRIGGTLWSKPLEYIENSPVFYADRVSTPLLIMHNDQDGAVPWYQGIEYFMALRRLDKDVWMLVYNNEQHNLTKRPNRVDLSKRMFGFFNYYLKGMAEPDWMKDGIPALEKGGNLGY